MDQTSVDTYARVPRPRMPLALARLHRSVEVGAPVAVTLRFGPGPSPHPDLRGGRSAWWAPDDLGPLFEGAGWAVDSLTPGGPPSPASPSVTGPPSPGPSSVTVGATRLRSLPDIVGPGMRLLVCGLNPSIFSADAGVNFARPGNRFWPAALAAGIVTGDRDPWHALAHHHIGFTDLVKRASAGAAELSLAEYQAGMSRLAWTVRLLRPGAVCFVGLAGWRGAVERKAVAGPQPGGFAGVPAYVMPNTSGLNAHTTPACFAAHLRAAAALGGLR